MLYTDRYLPNQKGCCGALAVSVLESVLYVKYKKRSEVSEGQRQSRKIVYGQKYAVHTADSVNSGVS